MHFFRLHSEAYGCKDLQGEEVCLGAIWVTDKILYSKYPFPSPLVTEASFGTIPVGLIASFLRFLHDSPFPALPAKWPWWPSACYSPQTSHTRVTPGSPRKAQARAAPHHLLTLLSTWKRRKYTKNSNVPNPDPCLKTKTKENKKLHVFLNTAVHTWKNKTKHN